MSSTMNQLEHKLSPSAQPGADGRPPTCKYDGMRHGSQGMYNGTKLHFDDSLFNHGIFIIN